MSYLTPLARIQRVLTVRLVDLERRVLTKDATAEDWATYMDTARLLTDVTGAMQAPSGPLMTRGELREAYRGRRSGAGS